MDVRKKIHRMMLAMGARTVLIRRYQMKLTHMSITRNTCSKRKDSQTWAVPGLLPGTGLNCAPFLQSPMNLTASGMKNKKHTGKN